MLRKIIEKIREGLLRDIILETKWIYGYAARYKRGVLIYIMLGMAATGLGLGGSVASKYLIDAVTGHKDALILQIAALYAVLGFAKLGIAALNSRLSAKLSIQASNEIRAHVFRQFLNIDWQASLDYHSGDLLSRVSSDVSVVSDSILGWIPSLVTGLAQFIGTLAVILAYDPVMALIALLSAPVSVFMSRFLISKMRTFGRQMRQAQAELTSFYEEALQNLQAIKSFSLNDKFSGRLNELQAMYKDISLDYNLFSVKTHLLLSATGFVVSGLCFAWGVYRLWSGYISFGTMVLFIQMASLLASSFSSLLSLVPSAISATVSARRIMTILELPREDLTISTQAYDVMKNAPSQGVAVQIEDLCFSYQNGRRVFDGLSLRAAPGEIIGVVSPSGGGKTTLIRMLLGLVAPSSGSITLESGGCTSALTPCMRSLITYVAQEKVVFSGTVADCLRMSNPFASDAQLEQALRLACAWDFVSALPGGIYFPLRERGNGLSEGQIQRLAIARSLLSDAPVMLLDEATSALDLATERSVLHNTLSFRKERTVIVTTHRPTVLLSCNRVYSIEGGRAKLLSQEEISALTAGHA